MTESEKLRVRERAQATGLTESEWCRQMLIAALDAAPDVRFLAGELMAIRGLLHGVAAAIPGVDAKGLSELQRKVDAGKDEAASKRWKQFAAAMTDGSAE